MRRRKNIKVVKKLKEIEELIKRDVLPETSRKKSEKVEKCGKETNFCWRR